MGAAILASPLASGPTKVDVSRPIAPETDGDTTKTGMKKEKGDGDVDQNSKRTKAEQ